MAIGARGDTGLVRLRILAARTRNGAGLSVDLNVFSRSTSGYAMNTTDLLELSSCAR